MAVPFYVRGLAEPGKDGPFHTLDAQLQDSEEEEIVVTGRQAARLMAELAMKGQQDTQQHSRTYPMPYLCPDEVNSHHSMCGPECAHDQQCVVNHAMWRAVVDQDQRPYAGELSDGLAQHLLDFYVADTEDLRREVAETLQAYGDLILKRWKKMSQDKRGSLLSGVSLPMFGLWPTTIGVCPRPNCYEEHFWYWHSGPWMNLRDMASDWMKLMSVLQVRTAYGTAAWVTFDTRNGSAAWNGYFPNVPARFSRRCVVMSGDLSDVDYATLTEFNKDLTHHWATMGLPRALMTTQAQHELMYTLQIVLNAIIGDSDATGNAAWTAMVNKGLHPAGQNVAWNPYTCQAFTVPEQFSPARLAGKAQDRLQMIKDELFLMQTDPAYMRELIRTKRVAISNITSDLGRENQLQHAGTLFMIEHYNRYVIWQTIVSRCDELAETFNHYGARCGSGMHMPREVSDQMGALGLLLKYSFHSASENFESIIHSTRALQSRFQADQFEGHLYVDEYEGELDQSKPADRLRWRLRTLRNHAGTSLTGGFPSLFEFALREEDSAQIMDKPTREYISDMMIIDDIRISLSYCQRGEGLGDGGDDSPAMLWRKHKKACCVYDDPDCRPPKLVFDGKWQQRISILIQDFMDVPWPNGKKDLKWLAKAEVSRTRLASLWKGIAREYEEAERNGGQQSACGKHFNSSATTFATDATHLAALQDERTLCEQESHRKERLAEAAASQLQQQILQTEWGSTPSEPLHHREKKSKIAATQPFEHAMDGLNIGNDQGVVVEAELIPVKKESLAVFRKMYRADSDCLAGGSVRWQVFVQAMKDADFPATESSGSAATFTDRSGLSISFHRPHPDPVLDHIMLYGMAKRLTKWFGFNSERFVLREKEIDAEGI